MYTLRNKLIVLAAVGILATVSTLMNSRKASAQGGGHHTVTIGAPLPVPVTGSVTSTVTGTVGLASGTTVGLAPGASVHVNNTVTDPVWVRNVNDAIQPFTAKGVCSGAAGTSGCTAPIFTVPAGKRAVIEYFAGFGLMSAGTVVALALTTTTGGITNDSFAQTASATVAVGPPGTAQAMWGQQVRLYADPGTAIQAFGVLNSESNLTFTISGYLVDVPSTP